MFIFCLSDFPSPAGDVPATPSPRNPVWNMETQSLLEGYKTKSAIVEDKREVKIDKSGKIFNQLSGVIPSTVKVPIATNEPYQVWYQLKSQNHNEHKNYYLVLQKDLNKENLQIKGVVEMEKSYNDQIYIQDNSSLFKNEYLKNLANIKHELIKKPQNKQGSQAINPND